MTDPVIRDEQPEDAAAVRAIEEAAFGQPGEADLVDALRPEPGVVSLVAEVEGALVGHLLLSPVTVEGTSTWEALALGPMAVAPAQQRRGVGSALVEASLARARSAGAPAVIVLGHPEYYPRFGFVPAAPHGFHCKWEVPPGVYRVALLDAARVATLGGGLVRYHSAFDGVT